MQGKMKSFFEDAGIILTLSAAIYGGYYFYTTLQTNPENENITKNDINKSINLVTPDKKNILKDQNKTLNITTNVPDIKAKKIENSILEKPEKKNESSLPIMVTKNVEIKEKKIIEVNIQKMKTIKDSIKENVIEKKEKKEITKVNKTALSKFIQDLESSIAQNIRISSNIEVETNLNLKIRVTVLPNGGYEQLLFVSGNKEIYNKNKKSILKVFPLNLADNIKGAFPRYLRMNIK